ncbi:MAG: AMP-dependent synthetase and ligase, partial [Burkholderia sp.]|nr:AMP-dependent synthetase and ligase [Burkholderia sp.]
MNKPWLQHYPDSVPHDIDAGRYQSLPDLFEQSFQRYSQLSALISMDFRLTYGRLDSLSRNLAAWLQHRGLHSGARV